MASNLEEKEEDTSAAEHAGISRVLADALQQMDEIIANSQLDLRIDVSQEESNPNKEDATGSNAYLSFCSLSSSDKVTHQPVLTSKAKSLDSVCALTLEDWINKDCIQSSSLAANQQLGGVARIRVANLVEDLSHVIQKTENADELKSTVSYDCLRTLRDWLLPDAEELFDIVSIIIHYLFMLQRLKKK
ncbi:hypothetical protein ElyMa_006671600 [Elysia marginata]|uniref:Uncharacterized protein n=1 Tax=Elysia marginata TaxID=1093978 RepID=A0AAV4IMF0_9GAST|nr:hypothetical protein ElyMa_006671600 [Elysia marginata]